MSETVTDPAPRDTVALISYRIEVKISDRWYFWGYSSSPKPTTKYELRDDEVRNERVFAAWYLRSD